MPDNEQLAAMMIQQGKALNEILETVTALSKVVQLHSIALKEIAEEVFGKPKETRPN